MTYVCADKERKIYAKFEEDSMPGYYSWWSLGTINKLPEVTEPVITRLSNGDAIKTRWTDLSSQFFNTSIFTIDFNTIITSYRNSYASTDKEVKVLYK